MTWKRTETDLFLAGFIKGCTDIELRIDFYFIYVYLLKGDERLMKAGTSCAFGPVHLG